MKKHIKYAIPFVVLFFILPMMNSGAIGTYTYGSPVEDWGTTIGDEHYFTAGWAFHLDLGDKAWDMLDMFLDYIDPALDGRTLYEDLANIESVYNFRITITNITNEYYNSSLVYNRSNDLIFGDIAWKAASMDEYGPLNATLIYQIQQNAMLLNAYSTLFEWGFSSSDLIEELEGYGPEMDEYFQAWDTFYCGEARSRPLTPPIFIPTDWNLEDYYNEMRGELDNYFYGNFSEATGVTVENWDQLTAALGFNTIRINKRDATVKFKLSSMNKDFLNLWVNNTGFYDNMTKIETYDALLDYLNITNFDAEARIEVEWNRKGILNNFHIQGDISGEYEGEKFTFSPQFDISNGEHNKINAKYTVPGYPVFLVIIAAAATVSIVIMRVKRKKS